MVSSSFCCDGLNLLCAAAAGAVAARCGLQLTASELPLAHRAYVYVDELAGGVVAHAAHAKRECCVTQSACADAGNADINCLGEHVLRMLCHACVRGAGAQEVVRLRCAVAADDVDGGVGLVQLC